MQDKLQFGYNAGLPDPKPLAFWGARAIIHGKNQIEDFDLVWDRQGGKGTAKQLRALTLEVDKHLGAAKAAIAQVALRRDERRHGVLIDNATITIVANPQASHGYLYLAAWLKAHER